MANITFVILVYWTLLITQVIGTSQDNQINQSRNTTTQIPNTISSQNHISVTKSSHSSVTHSKLSSTTNAISKMSKSPISPTRTVSTTTAKSSTYVSVSTYVTKSITHILNHISSSRISHSTKHPFSSSKMSTSVVHSSGHTHFSPRSHNTDSKLTTYLISPTQTLYTSNKQSLTSGASQQTTKTTPITSGAPQQTTKTTTQPTTSRGPQQTTTTTTAARLLTSRGSQQTTQQLTSVETQQTTTTQQSTSGGPKQTTTRTQQLTSRGHQQTATTTTKQFPPGRPKQTTTRTQQLTSRGPQQTTTTKPLTSTETNGDMGRTSSANVDHLSTNPTLLQPSTYDMGPPSTIATELTSLRLTTDTVSNTPSNRPSNGSSITIPGQYKPPGTTGPSVSTPDMTSTQGQDVTGKHLQHTGLAKKDIKYVVLGATFGAVLLIFSIITIVVRRQHQRVKRQRTTVLDDRDPETLDANSRMNVAETIVLKTTVKQDTDNTVRNPVFTQ